MRRYWLPKDQVSQDQVLIQGDAFHHIFQVCRQAQGSKFEVLTGEQIAYLVEVTSLGKKSAEAKVLETRVIAEIAKPHIHLLMSIPRFAVMDSVVERAVEMGVTSIQPFFSEFSFVRQKNSLPRSKSERWERIAISATQQCGRGELMKIQPALDKKEVLALLRSKLNPTGNTLGLFAYEGEGVLGAKDYLASPQKPEEIWVVIGGEGGFSPTEIQEFKDLGLVPVTLGEQVLRVETACIALVSILKYRFDLMR